MSVCRGKFLVQMALQKISKNNKAADENNNETLNIQEEKHEKTESCDHSTSSKSDTCTHESDIHDFDDNVNDPDWDAFEYRGGKRKRKVAVSESDSCTDISSDEEVRYINKRKTKKVTYEKSQVKPFTVIENKTGLDKIQKPTHTDKIDMNPTAEINSDHSQTNEPQGIAVTDRVENIQTNEQGQMIACCTSITQDHIGAQLDDTVNTNEIHETELSQDISINIDVQMNLDHEEEVLEDEPLKNKSDRSKKGESDPAKWEKNFNKLQRMKGKGYKGVAKCHDGKVKYVKDRKERIMGEKTCSKRCERQKMCNKMSERQRNKIFQQFWSLNWDEKRIYVTGLIQILQPQTVTTEGSRRKRKLQYVLKSDGQQFVVCKQLFLATLGIGERMMYDWLEEKPEKTDTERKSYLSEGMSNVQEYLDSLPQMPSHYCRSSSTKKYLEPVFQTIQELYRVYKENCVENDKVIVGTGSFRKVYHSLNFALFQPRKDQCDLCCGFQCGNVEEIVYQEHIKRKDEARTDKCNDKERAKSCSTVKVISVDLQSTLLSPKLKASAMYYKMKLACHNFTVYNAVDKSVVCYFWHEGEFGLSADAFASCLADYVKTLIEPGVEEIIIFSDGCGYQNRNITVANALLLLAIQNNVTIYQKYLEKGHTQMEVDSIHSVIERKIRNRNIFVPADYVTLIENARLEQRYQVKYLTYDFFKTYSQLKYYNSIRPGENVGDPVVTNLRVLKYNPSGIIEFKLQYSDHFQEMPRRVTRVSVPFDTELKNASNDRAKIKYAKYKHLQQLKSVLPKDYHSFYETLLHDGEK